MATLDTEDREPASGRGLKEKMEEFERAIIQNALTAAGGNQRRAAAALGVLPTTLCEKMKRLGLRDRFENSGG
jgi:DNA-binding NtrC family response regulator